MKNCISKNIRRKMIAIINEITEKENKFLGKEKETILKKADEEFFDFIFANLDLKNRKDMDEVMLLYMKLNKYLSEESYEIYIAKKDIQNNQYEYGYRKKENRESQKKITFSVDSFLTTNECPFFYLRSDNWDDYNYKTTFYLTYYDEQGEPNFIGDIKILVPYIRRTKEVIPKTFEQLPQGYYSLGQSINFYTRLSFFVPNYEKILNYLNDIAIDSHKMYDLKLEDNNGLHNSLLRFSEARKALEEVFKEEVIKKFSFDYEFLHMNYGQERKTNPIHVKFNFKEDDILPYRINAIIGKNGVGKTQIIKNLSEEISGMMYSNKNDDEFGSIFDSKEEEEEFFSMYAKKEEQDQEEEEEQRKYPNFSKIITVSYSAFDNFRKMKGTEKSKFNYVYCGLYKSEEGEDKRLSVEEIKRNILEAKVEIEKRGRKEDWFNSIQLVSESTDIVSMIETAEVIEDIQLSSGELVIVSCITDIIKYIAEQSLILFDEPELHLHPNAISNFMKMFNGILETYDSYAIISTHSPIIIQEIPERNVNIIIRDHDHTTVKRLGIECFGESIDNINKDVFYFDKSSLNYKRKFEEVMETNSYEKIVKQFDDKLSLNAKIYLKTLENQKEK